jgi:hypothetical protein
MQRVDVLAELLDLQGLDRDLGRAAQEVVQADAEQSGEALIDHLERGHAPTDDAHLAAEVVITGFIGCWRRFRADRARVHSVDEGIDLRLVEYLV